MRIAAVDIGTNTTLLTVADADRGSLTPVLERATITRLGRDLSKTGVIGDRGLRATRAAIAEYLADCRRLGVGKLRAVGTAAMRNARNSAQVRAAFAKDGIEVEIIPGEREAALTFLSALRDFGGGGRALAVIDVGGGSTEVILGHGRGISWRRSFAIGAVVVKETLMPSDPPSTEEIARASMEIAMTFADLPAAADHLAIAVAGTPTTLAAMHKRIDIEHYSRGAVHGTVLTTADLDDLMKTVFRLPLEARKAITGLEPQRADVIDTGAMILAAALDRLGADRVTASDGGVRWGLLWEMVG